MSQIGKMNTLYVLREVDFGVYLDGEELGDILLPKRQVPDGTKIDDQIEVFIYFDSADMIIASTQKPITQVNEFALLKVVDNNDMGAFMDWGLPKDLLVPFREQKHKLLKNRHYVVHTYLDNVSQRIVASTKLDKFLLKETPDYTAGDKVDLFIVSLTDLGYKAIIENEYWGLLFKDEVFTPLEQGQRLQGYIKQVRPDGKIDISLQKPGQPERLHVDASSQKIIDTLKAHAGFLPLTDKSPPDLIYREFGISKKVFKRSIGGLYKKRLIKLEPGGIRLNE
ncbi:MAG: S1-like domain-containing RNA-binding protein [Candidatus Marinimicrobia bacterium]|nr:S1-like domain-containing RNA-binding protein [Candidatus Neomarinimicrobiota bacterium]